MELSSGGNDKALFFYFTQSHFYKSFVV